MIDKKTSHNIDLLIKKIKENDLTSIKVSNKENSIEIHKDHSNRSLNNNNTSSFPKEVKEESKNTHSSNLITINSPMVGIIYITPKPSSPPFVKIDQKIKIGDTICLIEAMKTFNEIKSDKDGIIKSILVKNGEAVEFGQPLFEVS